MVNIWEREYLKSQYQTLIEFYGHLKSAVNVIEHADTNIDPAEIGLLEELVEKAAQGIHKMQADIQDATQRLAIIGQNLPDPGKNPLRYDL